ncbi:MAG: sulfatase-like hydrolase/transferase [Deltaproteobacteria bacterium]|nr:sulfatase-like hydrolase/transferase [Deltaproteobacteria bacterium]
MPSSERAAVAEAPARARPVRAAAATGTLVGAFVGALVGITDGILGLRAEGASLGVVALGVCLSVPLGWLFGLASGTIYGALRATLSPTVGLWGRLRQDADADLRVATGLLAFAACILVEVALVYGFAAHVAAGMANRQLAALSTALVAGAALLAVLAAFFPCFQLVRPLTRRVPRSARWPATSSVFVALALAGLAAGLFVLSRVDWRVLKLGPWVALGCMIAFSATVTPFATRRWPATGSAPAALATLALVVALAGGAPAAGRSEINVASALQEAALAPLVIGLARALGDRDRDGYAAWFAGGDCDDRNAAVHPGATDVPGNGVDENCQGGDATRTRPPSRKVAARPHAPVFDGNVLLLCIDTLRADMLGAMGHTGGLTPALDRLARRGVLFRRAFAQAANTPQSFPSIFTSLYPSRVPYREKFVGYPSLRPDAVTFFELLKEKGFATAAVTSHFYFTPERGITQGVDRWDNEGAKTLRESNHDIAAPRIVPRALATLKGLAGKKQRFALFVHLFEPHSTYVTHDELPRVTERGAAGLRRKYEYEVKYVDRWVGRLLEGLDQLGLTQRTAVVVFADHGEAFGEHRFFFHGQALYNEVLHVPLILAVPGWAPRMVDAPVPLLDLAPTVVELAGATAPEGFQGQSLVPLARGAAPPAKEPRRLGAVLLPYPAWPKGQRAALLGSYKAIHRVTENRFEIYDLARDPKEQRNLAAGDPALATQLKGELARFSEAELD